jgi:glutathione S-transferase
LKKNGGEFLLGKDYTWADLHIAHNLEFFEDTVDPNVLEGYAKLKQFKESVFNIPKVKEWVKKRPKTDR